MVTLALLSSLAFLPPVAPTAVCAQVQVIRGAPKKAKPAAEAPPPPAAQEGKVITVPPEDDAQAHLDAARKAKAQNDRERQEEANGQAEPAKADPSKAARTKRIQQQGDAVLRGFEHLNDGLSGGQ